MWFVIFTFLVLMVLPGFRWCLLPHGRLPRFRVRYLRVRLLLRLHPGRGHASVAELWLRWGKLAMFRRSRWSRWPLPAWQRFFFPDEHFVLLGRADGFANAVSLAGTEDASFWSSKASSYIRWQCSVCDDQGVISNWEDSPFDLRRRQLTLAQAANEIVIPFEVAAALRDLHLLDADCERLVFRVRAQGDHAFLGSTNDGLDELLGFLTAEAANEPSRRRQQRLGAAFDALTTAALTPDG